MIFWPVVKEILFKDISIFSFGGHFVQLSKFGRGNHEVDFCDFMKLSHIRGSVKITESWLISFYWVGSFG